MNKNADMNDDMITPPLPGFEESAQSAEAAKPVKVRKPRARKTAVVADAGSEAAVAAPVSQDAPQANAADGAAEGEPKPKRTRRPRKAAVAADEAATPMAEAGMPSLRESSESAVQAVMPIADPSAQADSSENTSTHADSRQVGYQDGNPDGTQDDRQPGKRRRKLRSKYGVVGMDRRNKRDNAHDDFQGERQDRFDANPGVVDGQAAASALLDGDTKDILFEDVISGQFDDEEATESQALTKRVLQPQPETPKLHKVLAQAGMGSRLELEQMITEGKISVNNEPAHIGQRIQFGDQIKVNGKPIRFRIAPPPARVLAYHKPVGEVVTHDDPQNRPTVFRRLPKLYQGKWQSVGRLDLNTEGLLLFTSSGELANRLMHPRFGLVREYAVRVLGALSADEKDELLEGVRLDDGTAQFQSIEDGGGDGANCWYRVTIAEGRNREVRRMMEAVGHAVSRLIRIRYGAVVLPRGLKRGAWLELDEREIRALTQASGGPLSSESVRPPRQGKGQGQGRGNRNANNRGRNNGGYRNQDAMGQQPADRFDGDRPSRGRNAGGNGGNGGYGDGNGNGRRGGGRGGRNQGGNQGGYQGNNQNNQGYGQGQSRDERPEKQPTADAYMQSHSLAQIRGRRRSYGNDGLPGGRSGGGQPDPMRTSVGYIGADNYSRQGFGGGQRRGGGGGRGGNRSR